MCDNFGKIQLRHSLPRNLSATVWDADGGIGVPKRQIRSCLVHIKGEGGGLSFASKGNQSICKGRKDRVGQKSKKNIVLPFFMDADTRFGSIGVFKVSVCKRLMLRK